MLLKFMEYITDNAKITPSVSKAFRAMKREWELTDDNLEFLHSGLIGNIKINFTKEVSDSIISNFTIVDNGGREGMASENMRNELIQLRCIDETYHVISTPIYHLFIYYIKLSIKKDEDLARDIFKLMCYRIITSLVSQRFSAFTGDYAVSKAAFENLSNQYKIKSLGTWDRYFDYRFDKDISKEDGKWYKELLKYSCDDVLLIIADVQNKIRKTVNLLTGTVFETYQDKASIRMLSANVADEEGKLKVREVISTDIEGAVNIRKLSPKIMHIVTRLTTAKREDISDILDKFEKHKDRDALYIRIIRHTHGMIYDRFGKLNKSLDELVTIIHSYYTSSGASADTKVLKSDINDIIDYRRLTVAVILYVYIVSMTLKEK